MSARGRTGRRAWSFVTVVSVWAGAAEPVPTATVNRAAAPPVPAAPASPGKTAPAAPGVPAPGVPAPPAAPNRAMPSPAPGAIAAVTPVEHARQGTVILQRGKRPVALGVLLDGDGRVLTSLSGLGTAYGVSALYADGTTAPVRLTQSDRDWDLALLTVDLPAGAPAKRDGVRAAGTPTFEALQTVVVAPPNATRLAPASLKPGAPRRGADGRALNDGFDLGFAPPLVGGPVVNARGEVVALVARACPADAPAGCAPAPFGVPVTALKQFLRKAPAEASWIGVGAQAEELGPVKGVRVTRVDPGSPAAAAGVRGGANASLADLIVAVDGAPVTSAGELDARLRGHAEGDSVELLLFGFGRYRVTTVVVRPAPNTPGRPGAVVDPKR